MNVYDQAYSLSKAIQESEEFKQYDSLKKDIDDDPQLAQTLKDFQSRQFEMQTRQMMGEQMGSEYMMQFQRLYSIIMSNPLAARYMEAQMRFSLMMNDVYKIIGEATGLGEEMQDFAGNGIRNSV